MVGLAASYHFRIACPEVRCRSRRGSIDEFDPDISARAPPHPAATFDAISGNIHDHAVEQAIAVFKSKACATRRKIEDNATLQHTALVRFRDNIRIGVVSLRAASLNGSMRVS